MSPVLARSSTVMALATSAPGIERLAVRPATLEDAYFAHTRGGAA